MKVKLEGHTDSVGNDAANKRLSNNRAKAVMDAIIAKGIDKSRLSWEDFAPTMRNPDPGLPITGRLGLFLGGRAALCPPPHLKYTSLLGLWVRVIGHERRS